MSHNKEAIGTLTGKFFHAPNLDGTVKWEGTFLGLASPGLYRCLIFEDEEKERQILVPAVDMRYWEIFESLEQMDESTEHGITGNKSNNR
jgi:hypothetical protein